MRISFTANEAAFDTLEYGVVGGVTDGEQYLTFQRAPQDDDDDRGVYLEFGEQMYAGYDCVKRCSLSRDTLTIDLSRPLGTLEDVDGFDVGLAIDQDSFEALRTGLRGVFRGKDDVLHVA